ncbi:inositol monophosphatase family protein [Nocardia nova]|uniref:inositol monophosphatase family protein n=1 Tax=Nocardia nova TaxID=37330 RepID=UPI0018952024|nr:inositol monophosphatase family protein [Nocardia nova]MBF6150276.1 inositol monophosphatase [Nocardia nova]
MIDEVAQVLADAAAIAIRPRFCCLTAGDVVEKAPGDLVTVADREAEQLISQGLREILDIPVVGEEAVAEDPSRLTALGEAFCWLVDPVDGTSNFVAGRPEYAVMAALLHHGEAVAGWILLPESGQLYMGERGAGAFRDGARIGRLVPPVEIERLRGAAPTKRLTPQEHAELSAAGARFASLGPGALSAGVNYAWILNGDIDFVLYQRSLPWDHAAGALLLSEVGGVSVRPDGTPYRLADGQNARLLNAADPASSQAVQAVLWGGRI